MERVDLVRHDEMLALARRILLENGVNESAMTDDRVMIWAAKYTQNMAKELSAIQNTRPKLPDWYIGLRFAQRDKLTEMALRIAWPFSPWEKWRAWATILMQGGEHDRDLARAAFVCVDLKANAISRKATDLVHTIHYYQARTETWVGSDIAQNTMAFAQAVINANIDPSPVIDAVLAGEGWQLD